MKTIYLFLIGSLLLTSCKQEEKTIKFDILIQNANIVNTETGEILKKQSIGINADTIAKIKTSDQATHWKAEQTVNAKNKYVIPGLWDMHIATDDMLPLDDKGKKDWTNIGANASFVLMDASCSAEAVARLPKKETVFHRGNKIV